MSATDGRLESEGQENCCAGNARAGSVQRLLERRGAEVLRCPLVTIYDSPHSAQVLAFAVKLADGGFDDFVIITGEGLTRILGCIDRYEPALRPRFVEGAREAAHRHARPEAGTRAARAGIEARTSRPPSPRPKA